MRPMRAHHEQELKQKFVGVREVSGIGHRKVPEAVLPTDLAKFAGPISKYAGKAGVRQISIHRVAAAIEAAAYRPAAIKPIFRRGIHAEGMLRLEKVKRRQLVARTPEELRTEEEVFVNRAAQRLPAKRSVRTVEVGEKDGRIWRERKPCTVPARVRDSEIEIGGFAEVAVAAQVTHHTQVLTAIGGE